MSLATLTPRAAGSTPIVFVASRSLVRTWSQATLDRRARYAVHQVLGAEPKREFVGPGEKTLQLQVTLEERLGLTVADELALLQTYLDEGTVLTFVEGGLLVDDFVITEASEDWLRTGTDGRITAARVNLTLESYT